MPKRRDPSRTRHPQDGSKTAPPEQAAVERALEQIVERLKPKAAKPEHKGGPSPKK